MAGVDILAIEEVAVSFKFDLEGCLIWVSIVTLISLVIGIAYCGIGDLKNIVYALFGGIAAGIVAGCLWGAVETKPAAYENHYKVIISEDVKLEDFMEKYEILDQEGKIYTVREKQNQKEEK